MSRRQRGWTCDRCRRGFTPPSRPRSRAGAVPGCGEPPRCAGGVAGRSLHAHRGPIRHDSDRRPCRWRAPAVAEQRAAGGLHRRLPVAFPDAVPHGSQARPRAPRAGSRDGHGAGRPVVRSGEPRGRVAASSRRIVGVDFFTHVAKRPRSLLADCSRYARADAPDALLARAGGGGRGPAARQAVYAWASRRHCAVYRGSARGERCGRPTRRSPTPRRSSRG